MLGVATCPHGCVAILADEATLSRELRTSCDARLGRILRAVPQVRSLGREHDSNSDDLVSHPNDTAQLRRGYRGAEPRRPRTLPPSVAELGYVGFLAL